MNCLVCDAKPGQECRNLIDGHPRPDHIGRYETSYCFGCGMPQPTNHHCRRETP